MTKQDLYLTPHPKTHSKWIKELNVKTLYILKILEGGMGECFCIISVEIRTL